MFLPHIDISRPAPHLGNRQAHDHETNQFFFLFEHRWLSYHGRNGALKRQRCWPSRAGIYSRLCLVGYAKNPGKSWFVKGFWWSCTDLPRTLSTSLANRYWIPISLLSWRCGLADTTPHCPSPTKPPVSQAKSLCKVFPVYRCIWVLWKCEMNMEIGQVPFLRVFNREKKRTMSILNRTLTEHVREGRIILFALVANQNTWFTTSFHLKELFK